MHTPISVPQNPQGTTAISKISRKIITKLRHAITKMTERKNQTMSSREHFQQSHLELRYLASGSNGSTYIGIRDDLDQICENYADHGSKERLCTDLRKQLVVVKYSKPAGLDDKGLEDEINILKMPHLEDRPEITSLVDFHVEEQCQWFTMAYVPGSDLNNLVKNCWKDIDLGLHWHIALSVVSSLVLLHFGITDTATMAPCRTSPLVRYADMHCGNILVCPDTDYPSQLKIVLADFGRSEEHHDATSTTGEEIFKAQRNADYNFIGYIIQGIFYASKLGKAGKKCRHCRCRITCKCDHPDADCEECVRVVRSFGLLPKLSKEEKLLLEWVEKLRYVRVESDQELLEVLKEFADVAKKERHWNRRHAGLASRILEYLNEQTLRDEELLKIVGLE